jgi:subtilase family serine protease
MSPRRLFGQLALGAIIAGLAACGSGLQSNQVPIASSSVVDTAHRSTKQLRAFAADCASNGTTAGAGNCTNIELASTNLGPTTPAAAVPGLHPADLQAAYALPSATAGTNQTIGIVIVNNDPNLESDLAVYRSTFGLPACASATGCLRVIPAELFTQADVNWSHELSTDVDMASAACPKCRLLVVEAKSSQQSDLAFAVSIAVLNGATVVSNSYVIPEAFGESNLTWSHPGVPIVAAAGDAGYSTPNWPAASSNVIAVGATTLLRNPATARGWSEIAWAGSGSGCSTIAAKPSWQTDTGCKMRTVADVAAVGDPLTPVAVYDSYQDSGWILMGGTSVATPIVAGVYALASNGPSLNLLGLTGAQSNPGSYLYAHRSSLFPVSSGSNGTCSPNYLCTAGAGYSGPTGLGSPNGIAAF